MPAGGALFGSAASGPGSTGGNKHLVEVRAGKMYMKGRMVYPDKRKGLIFVYQSEDSLMHFCWQDRTTAVVEDDLIIFPDDCEYVKVPQCTTGRAYLLKFKSSSRRFFFWLQEPSADKDEDNCKRINEYLNNPSTSVPSGSRADSDLQSLLNNMSQSQLAQLFGGVGQMGGLHSLLGTVSARTSTPAITHCTVPTTSAPTPAPTNTTTTTPTVSTPPNTTSSVPTTTVLPDTPKSRRVGAAGQSTRTTGATDTSASATTAAAATAAATGSSSNPIQLSDLQNFLQGMATAPPDQQSVDLSTALNADALSGLLSNPDALQQLQSHLPPVDGSTQDSLRSTLQSPQFQQAVSQFSSALESGQLGPIVSQLAVNAEAVAAASHGDMQEFVKALQKAQEKKDAKKDDNKDKPKDGKKDDDEEMQLD